MLRTELALLCRSVLRNADHDTIRGGEFTKQTGKRDRLFRASAGVGAGKEENHHIFAGIVGKFERSPIGWNGKIRYCVTCFKHPDQLLMFDVVSLGACAGLVNRFVPLTGSGV
mgnify:FL=1